VPADPVLLTRIQPDVGREQSFADQIDEGGVGRQPAPVRGAVERHRLAAAIALHSLDEWCPSLISVPVHTWSREETEVLRSLADGHGHVVLDEATAGASTR